MNKKRFIWLVSVLVMALAISACNNADNGDDDSPIGVNLKFTDELVYNTDGTVYMGVDKTITIPLGGTGLIRGGKMTFNIGTPNSLVPIVTLLSDMDERLGYNVFSRVEYDPFDAHGKDLAFTNLTKKFETKNATSITKEETYYIYVDKDCTLTAKNIPSVEYIYHDDSTENDIPVSVTVSNFTLKLKRGWNPVTKILMASATRGTLFIGPGDSKNCKWVLE
jgi:hypothetical protein